MADSSKIRKKGKWLAGNMKRAVQKVLSEKMACRQAAVRYEVPRSTLFDRVKVMRNGGECRFKPKLGRFVSTFSDEYERTLAEHVKDLSNRCMPLTRKEFLKLAFELAESLKLNHRFNTEKKSAGKHFYYDFLKRHPELSLRTPESTSLLRAVGFNKPQVDRFFENLSSLCEKYKFRPSNIYNCDETGVSTVHKQQKVLSIKSNRQVGKLTSAERGKNVTVLFCMSATGFFVPPLFVFPRQRSNERLMIGAPPESLGLAQPNGWMNGELFLKWLHHFVTFSKPSTEDPVLLVLDGHCSHKELPVINFAKDNNVHILSTPPHTTHKLQPLDRVFMKPFKDAYFENCGSWMRANAGARITEYDIAGLVAKAFNRVARREIAASGFQCTGIYPYNNDIFPDSDFLPSEMTEVPLENVQFNLETTNSSQSVSVPSASTQPTPIVLSKALHPAASVPSTSQSSNSMRTHIELLSPVPNATVRRASSRRRKAERSEILTSSPYKVMLEEKQSAKMSKTTKKKSVLKSQSNTPKKCKKSSEMVGGSSIQIREATEEQTTCLVCLEKNDEDWIQCYSCEEWAHEACADIPECADQYICDRCRI